MAIYRAGRACWGIDPYAWEHEAGITLTPIELALWHDIRAVGAVLYPQYPVGRFFVDFGNPVARLAIECDGAQWHRSASADALRQREIEEQGWTVHRISGRDCKTDTVVSESETGALSVQLSPARRFLLSIAESAGIRYDPRCIAEEISE
jgi:very-short-patch-repair endonuclease